MKIIKNIFITGLVLILSFVICLILHIKFSNNTLVPAIFVVGTLLTSVFTNGYIYGITSALLGVLAVNYAFTFPYFSFDFFNSENFLSAIILIVVSLVTCDLTAKIKRQETVKAEGERECMRANLLRAVSHDLRTPLTAIYGVSSALLENREAFSKEQQDKMLSGICQETEWLTRMVENLLSITRLDNPDVKIIKSPVVLEELVDSVLIKFSKRYPRYEITVDIPEEFVTIPMDAVLIGQVLINMLDNAAQHSMGMTRLWLKVFIIGKKAVFEVIDNGCGIPSEKIKSIFSGNCHTDSRPFDGYSNAGIGLSVCASIIKAHGGEIGAENLKGGGAVFRFVLDTELSED